MSMAAILINKPCLFEQIFNPPLTKGSTLSLKKTGPGVSEEMPFKGMDGLRSTDDGRQVITIAHPEPSTQVS